MDEHATDDVRATTRARLSKDLETAIRLIFETEEFKASLPKVTKRPRTAVEEADDYANEVEYEAALASLGSGEGLKFVKTNVRKLFAEIEAKCDAIKTSGRMHIEVESKFVEGEVYQSFSMRTTGFSMQVLWRQLYSGTDRDASLLVAEFEGLLIFPSEVGKKMYLNEPEKLKVTTYLHTCHDIPISAGPRKTQI